MYVTLCWCTSDREKVFNENWFQEHTRQRKLADAIHERRLRWCGHVGRMSTEVRARIAISAMDPLGGKRKIGHPHTDWMQTVKQNNSRGCFSWSTVMHWY